MTVILTEIPGMDPVFMAFSLFRRHRLEITENFQYNFHKIVKPEPYLKIVQNL